jgi:iron complex outermembrane receptor protein
MYAKTFRRLLLASSVLWASHAHAETAAADARALSEVVVTARRADESASATKSATPLIETPQSVSVIDRTDLDLRVVQNLNEAIHFTAGMGPDTRGNTGGRYDLQTLRGFSADQYLDGMRLIGSANGYATPQVDLGFLERVEVVKGPASVMYGSASPGGLVALSSKLPSGERAGQFTLSGGSFATLRGVLDLTGPLNDSGTLSYRLVTLADRSDTETKLTGAKRYGISPSLTWRPDDKTSWTLLYNYQRDPKTGDYGAVPLEGSLLPNPNGHIARDFYVGEPDFERFDRTQNAFTSLFTRDLGGDWTFRQSARFMRTKTKYRSAYLSFIDPDDLRTLNRSVAVADETVDALTLDNQLSGKLQTGPVTHAILVGLDYQNTRQTEAAGFGGSVAPIDAFAPVYGAPVTLPDISFNVGLRLQQTGLYAQDQMALGGFRLVLSGRNDWVTSNQTDRLAGGRTHLDQHKFTGRAGLLYLFDNGIAPYASYSTSFQPQTATDRAGNILPPTVGKQVEVGVKYQPKVWNALFTAALYDLRQTNVATQDQGAPPGVSVAAGEVRSRGIELEGSAAPTPALRLKASYTYLDNVVLKDNGGLVGARPYGVPQATANGYAVYTFQDGPLEGLGLGGAVRYLGRSYNGVAGVGEATIPAATLFDLLGSYDLGRLSPRAQGLTLNLDVTNLFDKRYISSCYSTIWCWYGSGRNVQASLSYRW